MSTSNSSQPLLLFEVFEHFPNFVGEFRAVRWNRYLRSAWYQAHFGSQILTVEAGECSSVSSRARLPRMQLILILVILLLLFGGGGYYMGPGMGYYGGGGLSLILLVVVLYLLLGRGRRRL